MSIVIEKKVLTKEELEDLHLLQQDFQKNTNKRTIFHKIYKRKIWRYFIKYRNR